MSKKGPKKSSHHVVRERIYNPAFQERGNDQVVLWDIFPLETHRKFRVVFESISSTRRQGVRLSTDGGITVNGVHALGQQLWYDSSPTSVVCDCISADGLLSIYNLWEDDNGRSFSQGWTSGMLVEELHNGRRYSCTDFGLDTNFDKLIFRVEIVVD